MSTALLVRREVAAFIPELSLVAALDGSIAGHVAGVRDVIHGRDGRDRSVRQDPATRQAGGIFSRLWRGRDLLRNQTGVAQGNSGCPAGLTKTLFHLVGSPKPAPSCTRAIPSPTDRSYIY